jgi:ATP-dependent DNA ligase
LVRGLPAEGTGGDRRRRPLPGFTEPTLASPIEKVPSGERWIHEIKFDGYRVQVHLANEAEPGAATIGPSASARLPTMLGT